MSTEPLDVEAGGDAGLASPSSNLPPEPPLKGPLKPIAETTPLERVCGVVGAAAVATSLVAMIIEQSAIVIAAGVLSCIVGPYAYWQQTRLTDIKALKETHAAVQAEVDRLAFENERLSKNIADLTVTVDRLEDVEQALDVITKTQGQNVNVFEKQVAENREILKKMQLNLKSNVLQNLLSVIMASDTDKDCIVDEAEIETLIHRIQNIGGVQVHDDRFRAKFSGNKMSSLMNVVQNLMRDDIPEEEKIFEFKDK